MSRNPYIVDGKPPSLQNSVFAFIDILGYTGMVADSQATGESEIFLQNIHSGLAEGRTWLEDKNPDFDEVKHLLKKDFYVLKAFTDNIVMGWPIRDDGEIELGMAFSKISQFQYMMTLKGFFIRGAISIGRAYVDDIAVFGDALIQAHDGESNVARDPRVILTSSAVNFVNKHLDYYSSPKFAPQTSALLCDSDGQWFINYLDQVLIAEDHQGPFYDDLLQHKKIVEEKLLQYKNNPPIFSKYSWVASYHNFFCDLHAHHFNKEHRIRRGVFQPKPKLIFEK